MTVFGGSVSLLLSLIEAQQRSRLVLVLFPVCLVFVLDCWGLIKCQLMGKSHLTFPAALSSHQTRLHCMAGSKPHHNY